MGDILGRLCYVANRQLFAVAAADAGCGKSTLNRRFAPSLPKGGYFFLYLPDSQLSPRWFHKGMLDQLGIESRFYRGDARRQLQKRVKTIRGVQGKVVVLASGDIADIFGGRISGSQFLKMLRAVSNCERESFVLE